MTESLQIKMKIILYLVLLSQLLSLVAGVSVSDSVCIKSEKKGDISYSGTDIDCMNGDVFLKGNYLEVGIHNSGSLGTNRGAPQFYRRPYSKLGAIADYDKNGFDSASPGYAGDYVVEGRIPLEGWILQYTTKADNITHRFINEGLMGNIDVQPILFRIISTDQMQAVTWSGVTPHVKVDMNISFMNDDLNVQISVKLTNIAGADLKDVYCTFSYYYVVFIPNSRT